MRMRRRSILIVADRVFPSIGFGPQLTYLRMPGNILWRLLNVLSRITSAHEGKICLL